MPEKKSRGSRSSRILGRLKLTLPLAKEVLIHHKRAVLGLALISILLGITPTLKSELESGVIDQISVFIRDKSVEWRAPLGRFRQEINSDKTDVSETIAVWLFGGTSLITALGYYLALALIVYLISVGAKSLQATISRKIFARLRGEGIKKGLLVDPQTISSLPNGAGQYTMAIQQGASNFWDTYGYFLEGGQYLFSLLTTVILVAFKSWVLALCCVGFVTIQVTISFLQARRLREKRNALDKQRNDLVGRTDDILNKREIILAYEQQDKYRKKLDDMTEKYAIVEKDLEVAGEKYQGFSNLIGDYGRIIIPLSALYFAFKFDQSSISDFGDVYFLLSIYSRILYPATNLLRRYDDFKRSEATSETFLDILASPEPADDKGAGDIPASWDRRDAIRFEDVKFEYQDGRGVLNGCTFRVPARRTTMVVGRSGSGKSTISRIILGFCPVTSGEVLVYGRGMKEWNHKKLLEQMAYVAQGDHIIDDTVYENLSWGFTKDKILEDHMKRALRDVKIPEDAIQKYARSLSLGQQQRLAFARMMLDESDIVILDEPFSGVDVFTIRDLAERLIAEFRENKRTVLMFSHRLAFAGYADHVIVLGDDGKIKEEGSPQELMNRKGEFYSLYNAASEELRLERASTAD